MRKRKTTVDTMPVITDPKDIDQTSGSLLERLLFNHRIAFVAIFVLVTLAMGYQASKVRMTASFEKMIPHNHPYIQNYLKYKGELPGLGNAVRICVENTTGDIYDPEYLEVLRQVTDAVVLTPGVDRAWVKSIWTPAVRWNAVTELGFAGGPVMPPDYDGSTASIDQLRTNVANAGITGSLIATDNRSSMIVVPLLEINPKTRKPLDYRELSANLEKVRSKESDKYRIHIIGFAKLVGDLMDGLAQVIIFFGVAIVIASLIIYLFTRCLRSTAVVIVCSLIAVIWQLGLLVCFGFSLDPYSILVPFLVFAIGVSHGVQTMNGVMQFMALGNHRMVAARYGFRRLFMAGLTALITDAVGFSVMMIIDIPVIRELAMLASMGVPLIIITNLMLIPVVLSFTGVGPLAVARSLRARNENSGVFARVSAVLARLTERRWATGAVVLALMLGVLGFLGSKDLKVGDLDPGAPELRANSRYNLDNQYITDHYALSSDVLAVIVKTPPMGGMQYKTLIETDRLAWELQQMPAVQTTKSAVDSIKMTTAGTAEGSPKWYTLSRNQRTLNFGMTYTMQLNPDLSNLDVSVMPLIAYLKDHKAETLDSVLSVVEDYAARHNTKDRQFLLAAGNAGVEAATNIIVKKANRNMILYVYGAVILLCFITFRSWRAVLVAVLPLGLTSLLCQLLMVWLGVGVKVATLPVIALGVGVGVDYALYLVSIQLGYQRYGIPLKEAYHKALQFTGKVVALVGVTFAVGVVTWAFSPIKFQADMGILLTFMFLWNMVGALLLIPALAHFIMRTRWLAPASLIRDKCDLSDESKRYTGDLPDESKLSEAVN